MGALLTSFTLNTNVVGVLAVPSLTVTVIVVVPLCPGKGVTVTVRFAPLPPNAMFASGTNVWLLDVPETVNIPMALSTSAIVNAIAPVGVFSCVE